MRRKESFQFAISFLILLAAGLAFFFFAQPQASTSELEVNFLDVGQGDAEYIQTPSGQDILIDGGPDSKVLNELGKVMSLSDREINLVILSHPHADHLAGLIEVVKRYKVDEVWETGVDYSSSGYAEWRNLIREKNIYDRLVKVGESENFGPVKITVLYPLSSFENKKIDNVNNASIVNRLDYNKFSVIFTGDGEKEVQDQLLKSDLYATVIKIPHHGSKDGLDGDFLKVVRPSLAVIEVGKGNTYGHPAAETLDLLKKLAVKYYRTDQNGTVRVESDGLTYSVNSY